MRKLIGAALALACLIAPALAQQQPKTTADQGAPGSAAWLVSLFQGGAALSTANPIFTQITNFPATQTVAGTVTANQGGAPWAVSGTVSLGVGGQQIGTIGNAFALDSTVQARLGTLGQKAMAASTPVAIASDQSTLRVSASSLPLPAGAATAANQPSIMAGGTTFGVGNTGTAPMTYTSVTEPGYSDGRYWPLTTTTWGGLRTASVQTGSANSTAGISPSAANAVTSLVGKAGAGNLYGAYALNLTSTPGFLVTTNAASVPASGAAIAPVDCRPLSASGTAEVNHGSGPADYYSTGVVLLISTSCTTYTPSTLSAYLKARTR